MPTNRHPIRRQSRRRLSWHQEMSLEWGVDRGRPPPFPNDAARREAWLRCRDYFLARCKDGWRPAAWWDYESPIPRPSDHDYEKATLWEASLLTNEERAELEQAWHEYFEQAQRPGFQHCIGHAKPGDTFATWYTGARARAAHYRWAGIPRELIKKWTEARQRRSRAIGGL